MIPFSTSGKGIESKNKFKEMTAQQAPGMGSPSK